MKKFLLTLVISLFSLTGFAQANYDFYMQSVKAEISYYENQIKLYKSQIKLDPNNSTYHRSLVNAQADLKILKARKKEIERAKALYKKLKKQNDKLDKAKLKLLELKKESEATDEKIKAIFEK